MNASSSPTSDSSRETRSIDKAYKSWDSGINSSSSVSNVSDSALIPATALKKNQNTVSEAEAPSSDAKQGRMLDQNPVERRGSLAFSVMENQGS